MLSTSERIPQLVNLLRTGDEIEKSDAARDLGKLAQELKYRDLIGETRAITLLIKLLKTDDFLILKYSTYALANLASSPKNQNVIAVAEGIAPLIELIQKKETDLEAKEFTAWTLGHLAEQNCYQLALTTAIPSLLALLKSTTTEKSAAFALSQLSRHPDNQTSMTETVELIDIIDHLQDSEDLDTKKHLITIMENFAKLPDNDHKFDKEVRMALGSLRKDMEEEVRNRANHILANLKKAPAERIWSTDGLSFEAITASSGMEDLATIATSASSAHHDERVSTWKDLKKHLENLPGSDEFVKRSEVSAAILDNTALMQKKAEFAYIQKNPALKDYYDMLNSCLKQVFTAAMVIRSGYVSSKVAESKTAKIDSYLGLIQLLLSPIPIAGQIAGALATAAKHYVSLDQENQIKRLLKAIPALTDTDTVIEQVARTLTLTFSESICAQARVNQSTFTRFFKSLKNRFIVDDVDTPYKVLAVQHSSILIKTMMCGDDKFNPDTLQSDTVAGLVLLEGQALPDIGSVRAIAFKEITSLDPIEANIRSTGSSASASTSLRLTDARNKPFDERGEAIVSDESRESEIAAATVATSSLSSDESRATFSRHMFDLSLAINLIKALADEHWGRHKHHFARTPNLMQRNKINIRGILHKNADKTTRTVSGQTVLNFYDCYMSTSITFSALEEKFLSPKPE